MNAIFRRRSCLTEREVMQYLRDELSDSQRYEVENHLLDCELCSAAVEGYAGRQDEGIIEQDVRELKSKVALTVRNPYLAWVNRVAAALLLLIFSYAAFRYWGATRPERLFIAYFEAAPSTYVTFRSPDSHAALPFPAELDKALEYYNSGAFGLSLPHFSNYLSEHPEDKQARFLAANAYLQDGQAEKAAEYFLQLEADGQSLQGQAPWYLALAYLRQGKMAEAGRQLERIQADASSPYREQAGQLLGRIR